MWERGIQKIQSKLNGWGDTSEIMKNFLGQTALERGFGWKQKRKGSLSDDDLQRGGKEAKEKNLARKTV